MFRLTSLRLEAAAAKCVDWCCPHDLIGGVCSLVHLEQLHFAGFEELGQWPTEMAAALRPLRRLQALVGIGRKAGRCDGLGIEYNSKPPACVVPVLHANMPHHILG